MDCLVSETGEDLQWINSIVLNEDPKNRSDNPELIWQKLFDTINGEPNPIFIYTGTYHITTSVDPSYSALIFPKYKVVMGGVMDGNYAPESALVQVGFFSGWVHNDNYTLHVRRPYYGGGSKNPGDEMLFTTNGYQLVRSVFNTNYWKKNKGITNWFLANYGIFAILEELVGETGTGSRLLVYIPINKDNFKMGEIVKIAEYDNNDPTGTCLENISYEYSVALDTSLVCIGVTAHSFIFRTIKMNGTVVDHTIDLFGNLSLQYASSYKVGSRALYRLIINPLMGAQTTTAVLIDNYGNLERIEDPFDALNASDVYFKRVEEDEEEAFYCYATIQENGGAWHVEVYRTTDFISYETITNYIEPLYIETPCDSDGYYYDSGTIRLYFDSDDVGDGEDADANFACNATWFATDAGYCHKENEISYTSDLLLRFYIKNFSFDVLVYIDNLYMHESENNYYVIPYNGHLGTDIEINEALWDTVEGGYDV